MIHKEVFINQFGQKNLFICTHFTTDTTITIPNKSNFHYHDYLEIIYVRKGNSLIIVGSEEVNLSSGEMIVIPPSTIHEAFHAQNTEFFVLIFQLNIIYSIERFSFETKHIRRFLEKNTVPLTFNISNIHNIDVDALFYKISKENNTKDTFYEMIIRSHITELIFNLVRYDYNANKTEQQKEYPYIITQAISYINENYAHINAKDVSNYINVSYNYFSYLFKKSTDMNFNEYITQVRLTAAKKLLLTTSLSITDIALSAGFSTTSHFITQFKKYTEFTPKKFRNSYQSQNI